MKDPHPIFLECVGPIATRYDTTRAFVYEGHLYATDSRMCVRTTSPWPEPEAWPPPRTRPPVEQLPWDMFTRTGRIIELPKLMPNPVFPKCDACDGAGDLPPVEGYSTRWECPECDGDRRRHRTPGAHADGRASLLAEGKPARRADARHATLKRRHHASRRTRDPQLHGR